MSVTLRDYIGIFNCKLKKIKHELKSIQDKKINLGGYKFSLNDNEHLPCVDPCIDLQNSKNLPDNIVGPSNIDSNNQFTMDQLVVNMVSSSHEGITFDKDLILPAVSTLTSEHPDYVNTAVRQVELLAETTRAQAAEASLQTKLDNIICNTDQESLDSLCEIVTAYQAADTSIHAEITAEKAAREAADAYQAGLIGTNSARIAVNENAILTETSRAIVAEASNAADISTNEANITTNADNISENATAISNEVSRAQEAEESNATNITTNADNISENTTAISNEVSRAQEAEASNAADISTNEANITTNATAISNEVSRATAAEESNATNISANATAIQVETARAIAAEQANATNIAANVVAISNEVSRATAAEESNAANISTNATNISENTTAISNEVSRAQEAEASNASDISTNAANISTNAANISTNATNISKNATDISNEVSRAQEAEQSNATDISANETAISAETSRAQAAEASNEAAIQSLIPSAEFGRSDAYEGLDLEVQLKLPLLGFFNLNGPYDVSWAADGNSLGGNNKAYYQLTSADVGKTLTSTITPNESNTNANPTDSSDELNSLVPVGQEYLSSTTDPTDTVQPLFSITTQRHTNPLDDSTALSVVSHGTEPAVQQYDKLSFDWTTGVPSSGFTVLGYQWKADDADIMGATDTTFTVQQAQVGKYISLTISFTDGDSRYTARQTEVRTVTSALTALVANVNDPPEGEVTISVERVSLLDEWIFNVNEYELTSISLTNDGSIYGVTSDGTIYGVTSESFSDVSDGTVKQYDVLTLDTSGISDQDGLVGVQFTYQWNTRDTADGTDTAIVGATDATFIVQQAQVGKVITVTVSYTDNQGTAESVTSAPTAQVENVNDPPEGEVTISVERVSSLDEWIFNVNEYELTSISLTNDGTLYGALFSGVSDGTVQQYDVLTLDTSGISDLDGLVGVQFTYQWNTRDTADGTDTAIVGAIDATFIVQQAQVGKYITVTASYTDNLNASESVTSDPTAQVANVDDPVIGDAKFIIDSPASIAGTAINGVVLTNPTNIQLNLTAISDLDGIKNYTISWYKNTSLNTGSTLDEAVTSLTDSIEDSTNDWTEVEDGAVDSVLTFSSENGFSQNNWIGASVLVTDEFGESEKKLVAGYIA